MTDILYAPTIAPIDPRFGPFGFVFDGETVIGSPDVKTGVVATRVGATQWVAPTTFVAPTMMIMP